MYLKSGYRALAGERAWKAIGDSLQVPRYLSIIDHYWTIRARKQRTEIGKYSFVNKSITDWNTLPEGAIGPLLTGTRYRKGR